MEVTLTGGVYDGACVDSFDCPTGTTCVIADDGDSWCGGDCSSDNDCAAGCCGATNQGALCYPARQCAGVEPPPPPDGGPRPDATPPPPDAPIADGGIDASPDATAPDAGPPPDASTCAPVPLTGDTTGHHNAGFDCLNCHGGLAPQLRWTIAGTVYADVSGSAPVAGGSVEVIDANGKCLTIPTAPNGNFWTTEPVSFPIKVSASNGSVTRTMNGTPGGGSCNSSSCHGPSFRVHVP